MSTVLRGESQPARHQLESDSSATMGRSFAIACGICVFAACSDARADEPATSAAPAASGGPATSAAPAASGGPATTPVELRHDLRIDLPVTAGLAAIVIGWRLVRDDLEPSTCRWCDGSSPGEVNAVDDWFRTALRRPDIKPANYTSYILAFGAAPLSALALTTLAAVEDNRSNEALVNVLAIIEGGATAMLVTEILEPIFLRTRPYVHAMTDDEERAAEIAKTGAFHSFPAGHVVGAFGIGTAAGVVASMRRYRLAPLVWAAGLMLGVATAYTRMAADRHYFTDVLAGAAIGTVSGGAVPLLFHGPVPTKPTALSWLQRTTIIATPVPGGQAIGVGGSF
jgi:membrane-associated phospholipid phosphatase